MQIGDRIAFRGGLDPGDQGIVLDMGKPEIEGPVILDVLLDSGARVHVIKSQDWIVVTKAE